MSCAAAETFPTSHIDTRVAAVYFSCTIAGNSDAYNHKLMWSTNGVCGGLSMRSKTLILLQRLIQTPYSGPLKEYQIKSSFNFKHFKLFFTRVCFRTSTSACLCLLISEFLTVTWRSCSSAAHPSTSRSADAPAEPRWSVSVCLCVCYLYCAAALLPCSLCAGYHGNWPGVRPG